MSPLKVHSMSPLKVQGHARRLAPRAESPAMLGLALRKPTELGDRRFAGGKQACGELRLKVAGEGARSTSRRYCQRAQPEKAETRAASDRNDLAGKSSIFSQRNLPLVVHTK